MPHHPFPRSQDYLCHLNFGRLGNNLDISQTLCQVYFGNNPIPFTSITKKAIEWGMLGLCTPNYSPVDLVRPREHAGPGGWLALFLQVNHMIGKKDLPLFQHGT